MILRRKGYLQQKIKNSRWRKESGQIEWLTGCFFLLFLAIILCTRLQLDVYRATAFYLEDALAASNLASAIIDLQEYGRTHTILIANPIEAYGKYCTAVQGNLQLNENWECENKELIAGKVNIINYTVYNVEDESVQVYEVKQDGRTREWAGVLGEVAAPNGIAIEATSIYSEIAFPVKGLGGITLEAHKGKLVDIVGNTWQ